MNLKQRRLDTGLTQAQVATELCIGQSQVSKYEDDPDGVPLKLLRRWLAALGLDEGQIIEAINQGDEPPPGGLEPGAPYAALLERLTQLSAHVARGKASLAALPATARLDGLPSLDLLAQRSHVAQQKLIPHLVLSGRSDAGKSRLANSLLGRNLLPSRYQPTTRLITHVRHVEHRPAWLKQEDVILFKGGSDALALLWDKEAFSPYLERSGSLDLLQSLGSYAIGASAQRDEEERSQLLVFADAPLLKAVHLVDLPGGRGTLEGADSDARTAREALKWADIVIHASSTTQFLNGEDLATLARYVETLPLYEKIDPSFPYLGHLFIVATHAAQHISLKSLNEEILAGGASRLSAHIYEASLSLRNQQTGRNCAREELRARFFGFWQERSELRNALHGAIGTALNRSVPAARIQEVDSSLQTLRNSAVEIVQPHIDDLQKSLKDLESAQKDHERRSNAEMAARALRQQRRREIEEAFERERAHSQRGFETLWLQSTSSEGLKTLIEAHYPNRVDAQSQAAAHALTRIRAQVLLDAARRLESLGERENGFLANYQSRADQALGLALPVFDAGTDEDGFRGAAAGLAIGALAGLSDGLTLILGGVLWGLMGTSWQERLAKKLASEFSKGPLKSSFDSELTRLWDEHRQSFSARATQLEQQAARQADARTELLARATKDLNVLTDQLRALQELQTWFKSAPIGPGK